MHIECVNIPECRFYNTMTSEHKSRWICPECVCSQRKGGDNTETPVKSSEVSHVTTRRAAAAARTESLDETGMSLDDDTQTAEEQSIEEKVLPATGGVQPALVSLNEAVRSMMSELRQFREEMRDEVKTRRAEIKSLRDGLLQLSERVDSCRTHVVGLDERMKALELKANQGDEANAARLDAIERRLEAAERPGPAGEGAASVAELERTVAGLRLELNDRDQEALLADLEIGQLPEQKGENVLHSVAVLAARLGVPLEERDVVFAERVGAPPAEGARARRVVVRLARRQLRDELLRAARTRRGVPEGSGRVFVNERLTRPNRQLFHRAREECRARQWRYCWTRRGRVFVRRSDGAQVFQLRAPDDLVRVLGAPPI
ncbi:uncharacterized protein LOC114359914 [Ostrinia furnacalis]|uniref:uncharacterized protein LOC114359914 n=1 Tax=Ostrinia furnacalis TaxID=93504 RepID=UPI00103D4882|nr:uncharacterized protein LOC114359914 [Ostrinia furnacalis]